MVKIGWWLTAILNPGVVVVQVIGKGINGFQYPYKKATFTLGTVCDLRHMAALLVVCRLLMKYFSTYHE